MLKVSYLTVLAVPALARQEAARELLGFPEYVLLLSFTSSCSLLVATILYDVFCPYVVKRFALPVEFFDHMVTSISHGQLAGVGDLKEVSYHSAIAEYNSLASRFGPLRTTCFLAYVLAGATFGVLLVDRIVRVASMIRLN